jgi:hypothetical protein
MSDIIHNITDTNSHNHINEILICYALYYHILYHINYDIIIYDVLYHIMMCDSKKKFLLIWYDYIIGIQIWPGEDHLMISITVEAGGLQAVPRYARRHKNSALSVRCVIFRGILSGDCCRKGPLIIIKSPSLLLVRSRAARACLSVTECDGPPSGHPLAGPSQATGSDRVTVVVDHWRGTSRPGGCGRRARDSQPSWPGPHWPSRPGAGYMVGWGWDQPGSVTRRTDRLRSEQLFAWSGIVTSVHLCVFLYAYQAFGFLLDWPL